MKMVQECHPSYDLYQLFFKTGDTGHSGAARDRTYVICSHKERTSCVFDPCHMKDIVAARMKQKVQTVPSDYFLATTVEVQQEACQLAIRRGVSHKPWSTDLTYLLTDRERESLDAYESSYRRRFKMDPHEDRDLVVFLGDNGSTWCTWSAVSHSIPTFRTNAKHGLFWSPCLKRFMTSREKLAAMAWPVSEHMAKPMCCQVVPTQDIHRASALAGNAMHFTTVAVAQLIALSCFRPMGNF